MYVHKIHNIMIHICIVRTHIPLHIFIKRTYLSICVVVTIRQSLVLGLWLCDMHIGRYRYSEPTFLFDDLSINVCYTRTIMLKFLPETNTFVYILNTTLWQTWNWFESFPNGNRITNRMAKHPLLVCICTRGCEYKKKHSKEEWKMNLKNR